MTGITHVVLADDQELVRAGFRMVIESQADMAVVGEASNGRDAIEVTERLRPDVVLMDLRMPEMNGIEATRRIVASVASDARIIILTTFDRNGYVQAALRAGASGFLLKDTPPGDLLSAIRLVAGGDSLLPPIVTKRLLVAD
jgi:DNA-binding NarL/FixJ family response regulator